MKPEQFYTVRLRVIREQYATGYGGAKRAARILGMSPCAVRQFAHRHGLARARAA